MFESRRLGNHKQQLLRTVDRLLAASLALVAASIRPHAFGLRAAGEAEPRIVGGRLPLDCIKDAVLGD